MKKNNLFSVHLPFELFCCRQWLSVYYNSGYKTCIYFHTMTNWHERQPYENTCISFFFSFLHMSPQIYTIQDIEKDTNTFKKKIGEGGFGIVYDRKLNNIEIAVKVSNDSEKKKTGKNGK